MSMAACSSIPVFAPEAERKDAGDRTRYKNIGDYGMIGSGMPAIFPRAKTSFCVSSSTTPTPPAPLRFPKENPAQ